MVGSLGVCQTSFSSKFHVGIEKSKTIQISVKADSWQKSQDRKIKLENPPGCKSQQLNCRNQIIQITMAKACRTNLIKWIMQDNNADKTIACSVLQSDHTYKPYVGHGSLPSGLVRMLAPFGVWFSEMYL